MKKRKGIRRFIWPLVLLSIGFLIGAAIFDSGHSTVEFHHDFDYSEMMDDHAEEMAELQQELDEIMLEVESEINMALPEIPAIPEVVVKPNAPVIVVDAPAIPTSRTNIGGVAGVIGGLGITMIFVMAMMVMVDDYRGRRED